MLSGLRKTAPKQGGSIMSIALRFVPLVAAALMASAGHAATTCSVAGAKPWKDSLGRAVHTRILAFGEGCPRDCRSAEQAKAQEWAQTPAPLPLTVVRRAEDIADWHAQIFARLTSDRGEDGSTRYCGLPAGTRSYSL